MLKIKFENGQKSPNFYMKLVFTSNADLKFGPTLSKMIPDSRVEVFIWKSVFEQFLSDFTDFLAVQIVRIVYSFEHL